MSNTLQPLPIRIFVMSCLHIFAWRTLFGLQKMSTFVDHRVSEMLLLTKHDVDLSSEMAGNRLQQPELIVHIKEISLRHHFIPDRYAI